MAKESIIRKMRKFFSFPQNNCEPSHDTNVQLENIAEKITCLEQNLIALPSILWNVRQSYLISLELLQNSIYLLHDLNINKGMTKGFSLYASSLKASESPDDIYPESTTGGILRNPSFSQKIQMLFGGDASLLDIGCGAGGIVFDALSHGILAFGVDGSDYCQRASIGYWLLLTDNLKTVDATKPFEFRNSEKELLRFKVICSWECLEHIPEVGVQHFLTNVFNNLDDDGFFLGSISRMPYKNTEYGVTYHVTLKEFEWWEKQFSQAGLCMIDIANSPWGYSDFARGTGSGYLDAHTNYLVNKDDGFLFVAVKNSRI